MRIDGRQLPRELTGGKPEQASSAPNRSLWDHERSMIVNALGQAKWNQSQAARALGISRDNLRYRIKKYKITRQEQ